MWSGDITVNVRVLAVALLKKSLVIYLHSRSETMATITHSKSDMILCLNTTAAKDISSQFQVEEEEKYKCTLHVVFATIFINCRAATPSSFRPRDPAAINSAVPAHVKKELQFIPF